MSKSLGRVQAALDAAGVGTRIVELGGETRTAVQAAAVAGCGLDQIVKSIIFQGATSGRPVLFLTAGGNQVDPAKAARVAGEPLGRADADLVRAETGFAIGGVAPIGHLQPLRCFVDPRLQDFSVLWAASGTPRHIFSIHPDDLLRISSGEVADFTA